MIFQKRHKQEEKPIEVKKLSYNDIKKIHHTCELKGMDSDDCKRLLDEHKIDN